MATYITPDYVFNVINQKQGETRMQYLDRLSRIMLDETEYPQIRAAANKRLQYETSYE